MGIFVINMIRLKRSFIFVFILGLFLFCPLLQKSANAQMDTLCVSALYGGTLCRTVVSHYAPAPPPAPAFPDEMSGNANWTYSTNADGTYDINFTFNNPNSRNVSISINPTEYAD